MVSALTMFRATGPRLFVFRKRLYSHKYDTPIQETLSDRTASGSCGTEIARPKGTVVSTFGMQEQCVLRVALN